MRTWKRNKEGLFVTNCDTCGKERLTKKRPYHGNTCASCHGKRTIKIASKHNYNKDRNKKISEAKKKYWNSKTEEERRILMGTWMKDTIENKMSSYEIEFAQFLDELEVTYKQQYWVGGYPFDFYLEKTNQLIEIDGEYWHPLTEDDCKTQMHFDHLIRDRKKNKVANDHGYKLTRIRV